MYAKVFAQIYDGTLSTKGPWQALVTFQQMLVLADQDGNVDMTAGAIARRTTIPLDIIESGIEALMQPDPESRSPAEEGRRIVLLSEDRNWGWRVVNYIHYRQLRREIDRREYHRQYWRDRKAAGSTPTQHSQQTQPNQPIAEAEAKADNKGKPSRDTRSLLSDIPNDLYTDFVKLRQQKKAPITKTVVDGLRREAAKAGISLEQAIRTSCERNWQGFKAEWLTDTDEGPGGASHGGVKRSSKPWEGAR